MPRVIPEPGDVIEDYEILEKIGGNMGLVFKARHRLLNKAVALKLLPAEWIADPARLARFQRELRVMGQLEHPNLVTAGDARSLDSWHLVAMEWIEGLDLLALIRNQGRLPVSVACEMARQAALGLQYAHEHGLIHRDIKPSNLMLTRTGTIKVIDMGLALARDDSTAQLTQTGLLLGTMSYCAPEQFRDSSRVDIRADIYSLGCTLYHLLTGKSPYWQRKTAAEVMQAHLHEPFPSLTEARADAAAGLEAVLVRMIAKDPNARFSTPREVAEALEPFARNADLKPFVPAKIDQRPPARPTTGRTLPTPAGRGPATVTEQRPKTHWSRSAAVWAMLLVLGIAAAAFLRMILTDPVIVLMDTTAKGGVYDEEDRDRGASNTEKLSKILKKVSPTGLWAMPVSDDWTRDDDVVQRRPYLVVIHRSLFFHTLNARLNLQTNHPLRSVMYDLNDNKVRDLIGYVGSVEPRTQFLIYSRGTDPNWLDQAYRSNWVDTLVARFPLLKGRIETTPIPNGMNGTFKDPATQQLMRNLVVVMLQRRNWVRLAAHEPSIMIPLCAATLLGFMVMSERRRR